MVGESEDNLVSLIKSAKTDFNFLKKQIVKTISLIYKELFLIKKYIKKNK